MQPSLNFQPFNFQAFKKVWNSDVIESDVHEINHLMGNNPLLNQTLLLQDTVIAIKDISNMKYPCIFGDVEKVCGWPKELFFEAGVEEYMSKIPPEDNWGIEEMLKRLNGYVASLPPQQINQFRAFFDYRMKRQDGRVARILQESIVLKTDANGLIVFFLALVSDVSHLKRGNKQHLHLTNGAEHLLFEVNHTTKQCEPVEMLSKREMEIVKLMSVVRHKHLDVSTS